MGERCGEGAPDWQACVSLGTSLFAMSHDEAPAPTKRTAHAVIVRGSITDVRVAAFLYPSGGENARSVSQPGVAKSDVQAQARGPVGQ